MTQLSIIFLGTGGSWPTIKRNVTSIAVKRGGEVMLFDCGEGTQRQFQKSKLSYMQILKIFIIYLFVYINMTHCGFLRFGMNLKIFLKQKILFGVIRNVIYFLLGKIININGYLVSYKVTY